jgi:hypothetical protein
MIEEQKVIEEIAEKVAERVNATLFLVLGINTSDPEELIKLQKDLAHLRGWRESMEVVKRRSLGTAAGFLVTGIFGYILFFFTKH